MENVTLLSSSWDACVNDVLTLVEVRTRVCMQAAGAELWKDSVFFTCVSHQGPFINSLGWTILQKVEA